MVGYSGTPLPQKLGIKEGSKVALVDAPKGNKVCAIDDTWSGLRLVIRKEHRTK